LQRCPPRTNAIWTTIAFLGRYGRQPVNVVRALPSSEFWRLAEEVGKLLDEEKGGLGME
jgi:hypothetical protein